MKTKNILRFGLLFSLLFASLQSFAAKDVLVFVSTSHVAEQVSARDQEDYDKSLQLFSEMAEQANQGLPAYQRPLTLHIKLHSLNDLGTALREALQKDPELADAKIKMLTFTGHGNSNQFWLNRDDGIRGAKLAHLITSPEVHPLLAKDVGIYLNACKCGGSPNADGLQNQFMSTFKADNEALPADQQTRSLVSVAHRFSATATSFKHFQVPLEIYLYHKTLFAFLKKTDNFVFNNLKKIKVTPTDFTITVAVMGGLAVLNSMAGPDMLQGSFAYFYNHVVQFLGGMSLRHVVLAVSKLKWTHRIEYVQGAEISAPQMMTAKEGITPLMKAAPLSCEDVL